MSIAPFVLCCYLITAITSTQGTETIYLVVQNCLATPPTLNYETLIIRRRIWKIIQNFFLINRFLLVATTFYYHYYYALKQ